MKKAKKLIFKYDKLKVKCLYNSSYSSAYELLEVGRVYTIKEIELEDSFTFFHLEEIPNERFISILFDINIGENKEIPYVEVEDEDGDIIWCDIDIFEV